MNFLDELSQMTISSKDTKTSDILNKLFSDKQTFIHTGSRSVLPEEDLSWNTDYDFIAIDNANNRKYLESLGFDMNGPDQAHYFDIATSGIYYWVGPDEREIQVVLKDPMHWEHVIEFWELLRSNPKFYKKYFWKSSGKWENSVNKRHTMTMISDNINRFMSLFTELNY